MHFYLSFLTAKHASMLVLGGRRKRIMTKIRTSTRRKMLVITIPLELVSFIMGFLKVEIILL